MINQDIYHGNTKIGVLQLTKFAPDGEWDVTVSHRSLGLMVANFQIDRVPEPSDSEKLKLIERSIKRIYKQLLHCGRDVERQQRLRESLRRDLRHLRGNLEGMLLNMPNADETWCTIMNRAQRKAEKKFRKEIK